MALPPRVSDLTGFDLLLTVARLGSLGRAAAEHGMSQPAASARMRHLEGQLGLALIERSPRGSRLTPAGALVADWAQAAIDAAAALDAGVTALRRERDSRVRIAASMTVAEYLLPAWLIALRAADPGAAVALRAVNSADVAGAVLADAADVGFVESPDLPDGLRAEPVGADVLTVIVAPAIPGRAGPPGHHRPRTRGHPPGRPGSRLGHPPLPRGSAGRPGRAWTGCRRSRSCPRLPRSRPRSPPGPARRCSARSPSRPTSPPGRSAPCRSAGWTCAAPCGRYGRPPPDRARP